MPLRTGFKIGKHQIFLLVATVENINPCSSRITRTRLTKYRVIVIFTGSSVRDKVRVSSVTETGDN